MKIQCPCGAKYEIIVTPGMSPIQFVCANCGQDYSAFINDLIRRELGEGISAAPPASASAQAPVPASPPPQPAGPRLKISAAHPASAPSQPAAAASMICPKHREPATEHCLVCKKPICPKCMAMFGYFCSPFCKNKAADLKLDVPVFEGRGDLQEKRFWRKIGLLFAVVGAAAALFVGGWTWYAWYGSVPHAIFSVKFDEISHSGATFVVSNQIVLLHGGTLARYDLKTQKPVWSDELVTKQQIADALKQEDDAEAKIEAQYGRPEYSSRELPELREKHTRIELEETLSLRVVGQNIWVAGEDGLSRYDWNSGKKVQQIPLNNGFGGFTQDGTEWAAAGTSGETRVNLATAEVQTTAAALVAQNAAAKTGGGRTAKPEGGGLPLTPYGDASQPLDPQKVNQQMQHLTTPGRIALPAIVGENLHQQQLFKEMESDSGRRPPAKNSASQLPEENFTLIPDAGDFLQFSSKLIKENIVKREAMKAPPKKSALDSGNVGVMNEDDAINEQLNEMQRNRGGDTVTEDHSIYQVTVRQPGSPGAVFTTNVVGEPQLLALKTVNVITAGKTVIVLDKSNKKLWQVELAYIVPPARENIFGDSDNSRDGAGPCVERDGTLYVYDEATLSAFDLSNGNARWRLPSVGINGLFFDDKGDIYLSTSTASLDNIKYAKQIDLNNPTEGLLMKIDPQSGKVLWSVKPHGNLAYLSGKYLYTFYEFDPGDTDEHMSDAGILQPAFLRISRINPVNGKILWEYTDDHAPVNVQFDRNNIQIVFKKEVRLLHYYSF